MLRMNDSYSWAWGTYAKTMKFHGHKNKTSVQELRGQKSFNVGKTTMFHLCHVRLQRANFPLQGHV